MCSKLTLVTGATGKTGRRVARILADRALPARLASRQSELAFNWDNEETWRPAVEGTNAVYMVHPGLGTLCASEQVAKFAKVAAAADVSKVVLASTPDDGSDFSHSMRGAEKSIIEAGLTLTSLRLRWFYQNFSEDFLLPSIRSGEIRVPAGSGREAFVDAEDIAEVAVAALSDDFSGNRFYDITGPRLLGFEDIAEEISHVTRRQVRYIPLAPESYISEQVDYGVPTEWATMFSGIYQDIAAGRLETVSNDVSEILDKPARDFTDFVIRMSREGVWR